MLFACALPLLDKSKRMCSDAFFQNLHDFGYKLIMVGNFLGDRGGGIGGARTLAHLGMEVQGGESKVVGGGNCQVYLWLCSFWNLRT